MNSRKWEAGLWERERERLRKWNGRLVGNQINRKSLIERSHTHIQESRGWLEILVLNFIIKSINKSFPELESSPFTA